MFNRKITLGGLTLCLFTVAIPRGIAQECDLTQSLYRDVPDQGFRLEFYPSSSTTLPSAATVILSHPDRGQIFQFELVESQGYPIANLVYADRPDLSQVITFFDPDLIQTSPPGHYAFVEGLGYADWSLNQESGGREIVLGDVIWQFDQCRP